MNSQWWLCPNPSRVGRGHLLQCVFQASVRRDSCFIFFAESCAVFRFVSNDFFHRIRGVLMGLFDRSIFHSSFRIVGMLLKGARVGTRVSALGKPPFFMVHSISLILDSLVAHHHTSQEINIVLRGCAMLPPGASPTFPTNCDKLDVTSSITT